jgi:hypothetical protein
MTDPTGPEGEPTDGDSQDEPLTWRADDVDRDDASEEPDLEPAPAEPRAAGVPRFGRRSSRPAPLPPVPTPGSVRAAATPRTDEVPYIDDPVPKLWVGAIVVFFAAIFAYVLLFGNGGALTPRPTPEPLPSAIESPFACATPAPSGAASSSPAESGSEASGSPEISLPPCPTEAPSQAASPSEPTPSPAAS